MENSPPTKNRAIRAGDRLQDSLDISNVDDLDGRGDPSQASRRKRVGPNGEYEVLERIGQGGMGEVFRALDTRLERVVAIKRVLKSREDVNETERLLKEAKIASRLEHPNIVRVYQWLDDPDGSLIVMEFVPENLTRFMQGRPLGLEQIFSITADICQALGHVHDQGWVHRDVKPKNILITEDMRAKLSDFGMVGRAGFTEGYASPEQVQRNSVTALSDLYSLGRSIYEMATGCPPPGVLRPDIIPVELRSLVRRLTDNSPERRPASAKQVLAMVEELVAQMRRVPLPPPPPIICSRCQTPHSAFADTCSACSMPLHDERGSSGQSSIVPDDPPEVDVEAAVLAQAGAAERDQQYEQGVRTVEGLLAKHHSPRAEELRSRLLDSWQTQLRGKLQQAARLRSRHQFPQAEQVLRSVQSSASTDFPQLATEAQKALDELRRFAAEEKSRYQSLQDEAKQFVTSFQKPSDQRPIAESLADLGVKSREMSEIPQSLRTDSTRQLQAALFNCELVAKALKMLGSLGNCRSLQDFDRVFQDPELHQALKLRDPALQSRSLELVTVYRQRQTEYQREVASRREQMKSALAAFENYDYRECLRLLRSLPPQDYAIRLGSDGISARSLIRTSQSRLRELHSLSKQINEVRATGQWNRLRPLVERFLKLQPTDKTAHQLLSDYGQPSPLAAPLSKGAVEEALRQWEDWLGVGRDMINSAQMRLVLVTPGSFLPVAAEIARNRTQLEVPFFLSNFLVTQAQWQQVLEEDVPARDRHDPQAQTNTSYHEAIRFCEHLTSTERARGKLSDQWEYRLPTEAEWEYAMLHGANTALTTPALPSAAQEVQDDFLLNPSDAPYVWAEEVASGTGEGIADGNVWRLTRCQEAWWEWCSEPMRGQDDSSTDGVHVIRQNFLRAWRYPTHRDRNLGFRVALVPTDKADLKRRRG